MVLMLITDGGKSHYVHIKDLGRFVFNKTKNKNKKCFWKICLQRFSSKKIRAKYKEVRLSLTGVHSLRLEKGTIELKNYFKQIQVTFKIYVYFVCHLKSVESYEGSYSKVLLTSLFVLMMNLLSQ